ncbi:hypothetical protein [Candidatus Similichlamydia epinepheli]|uniref:hypothetical protein n=1 Tax=Candidatus Similichlamydia epinepheli TaxID=1903953 RepID=UPI000D3C51B1|nr:hypothetical protein [Candidatus Similichlamydia epinepheli]
MKNKDQKDVERAWNESIQLWKKRRLLAITSPKDPIEKEFALKLQQSFQKRLRLAMQKSLNTQVSLTIERLEQLAQANDLLPSDQLLKLYEITFYMDDKSEEISDQKKGNTVTLRIIRQQRKFAEKTKEIHQRKNWTPI